MIKKVSLVENGNTDHSHWILPIQFSVDVKFQLKTAILVFWTTFAQKELLPVKNRKSVHHHWVLYILISLGTKFQLKLTILNFWTKFIQKLCFRSGGKKEASLNSPYSNWFTVIHKKFVANPFLSCSATLRIS